MQLHRRDAYLTDRRLILNEGHGFIFIPFNSIRSIDFSTWGSLLADKIIQLDYGKIIRFNVSFKGAPNTNNEKTEMLYNWLRELSKAGPPSIELINNIKMRKEEFEKTYNFLGKKENVIVSIYRKPEFWLIYVPLFIMAISGGMIGLILAFTAFSIVTKINSRQNISPVKKFLMCFVVLLISIIILFSSVYLINSVLPKDLQK